MIIVFKHFVRTFLYILAVKCPTSVLEEVVNILGLSSSECWVLGADVALGAGGRFEGHGAAGALVEDLAVSSLNVGLDGVQPAEDDLAARASGQDDDTRNFKLWL